MKTLVVTPIQEEIDFFIQSCIAVRTYSWSFVLGQRVR